MSGKQRAVPLTAHRLPHLAPDYFFRAALFPAAAGFCTGALSAAPKPVVGTKGRILDHIGFEVKDLERFCKKLEAAGVKLDRPYSKTAAGLGLAFLTDPWGTTIELNEGLDRY